MGEPPASRSEAEPSDELRARRKAKGPTEGGSMPKLPGVRENFGSGDLLAIDFARVERAWHEAPAEETVRAVRDGSFVPAIPGDIPGERIEPELKGLDVAIEELTLRKLLDRPLIENLRARRSLRAPRKWFTSIPDVSAEIRVDGRLLRLAEISGLRGLSADEVMAVGSVVEREMVGAKEVRRAFERWADPSFVSGLEKVDLDRIGETIEESWGDSIPLQAAMAVDSEDELVARIRDMVASVRELVRFAKARSLTLVPWTRDGWNERLQARALARASA